MQRPTLFLFLAPLALAVPQAEDDATMTQDGYDLPSSIPASVMLSNLYGTNIPTAATGAAATSLASALYSYELSLYNDPGYKSAADAVYMAIATVTNADEILSSLEANGAVNGAYFTTADWFKTGVPEDAQTAIESYWDGYSSVATGVLGGAADATPTGTQSGGASVTGTGSSAGSTPTGAATSEGAVSSSPSSGGAPAVTGRAMVGLAAGVAMGVFAAI